MNTKTSKKSSNTARRESFRKELMKVMPGLKWTIHRTRYDDGIIEASAFKSSGSNRLFTLSVTRQSREDGSVLYIARSSGRGTWAKWLHSHTAKTAAQALRGLQTHYEREAAKYGVQVGHMTKARYSVDVKTEFDHYL